MRKCTDGNGNDSTLACLSYLLNTSAPIIRHLYMLGEPGDPRSILLTDYEAPLIYPPWGTFYPSTIKRGSITCAAGLDIQSASLSWTPGLLANGAGTFTSSVATANPVQLARIHYYDNWPARIWKIFMPEPGDASSLGGCEWFGGRVGSCLISRAGVQFEISGFSDVVSQKVPANVIESTSTLASYTGASLVSGETSQPTFEVATQSTATYIIADCLSPTPGKIYSGNIFVGGFMVFLPGAGATLAGVWSAIGNNGAFSDGNGNRHSAFNIFAALPWAPTPGVDRFYVSPSAPINIADGDYYGFPYVPSPTTAV